MNNTQNLQDWKITSETGPRQTKDSGPLNTLVLTLWVLAAIALIVLGFVVMFVPMSDDNIALALISMLFIVGIVYVFVVMTKAVKNWTRALIFGIVLLVSAVLVFSFSNFFANAFRIAVGVSAIVTAVFLILDVVVKHREKASYGWSIFWTLVYLVLGIAILFSRDGSKLLVVLTGIYLIILGLNILSESLGGIFYSKPSTKKKFVVPLPTFLSAFIPMGFYSEINEMAKREPEEVIYLQEPNKGEEPDLIVYIHTRAGFIPGFGHCDLCYDGEVYSYGDYDEATWKYGGFFADGVLAKVPPQKHIDMALKEDKKVLVAYGIQLTDELKKQVEGELQKIMDQTVPWKPKAQLCEEGELEGKPEDYLDVGSVMYLLEDAKMYKFKEGSKYKTYYALGENCSEVVNDVVGYSGIDLLALNGIITPGSYLAYLDELYRLDDSIVTSRRVYLRDKDGKPYIVPFNPKQKVTLGNLSQ